MHQTLFQRLALAALTAACLSTTLTAATAGGGSFTRGCAARDMQILMMIEQREGANAVYTKRLSDAMLEMMRARVVCHEGSVVDALALYDGVADSVTPIPVLSEQTN